MAGHLRRGGPVEEVAIVLQRAAKRAGRLLKYDGAIVAGGLARELKRLNRQLSHAHGIPRCGVDGTHRLKDWREGGAALRANMGDYLLERNSPPLDRGDRAPLHLGQ